MKRILGFIWLRIRLIWRGAKGLRPWPSKACNVCVLCGRKPRLWEEPFIPVFGTIEDYFLWFSTEPQVNIPAYDCIDRYQHICRDHGGKNGMVILDASTGDEVTVPPYRRRIKVYRILREMAWWVQVVGRFVWWSAQETAAFMLSPKRYIYWAKQLGGW